MCEEMQRINLMGWMHEQRSSVRSQQMLWHGTCHTCLNCVTTASECVVTIAPCIPADAAETPMCTLIFPFPSETTPWPCSQSLLLAILVWKKKLKRMSLGPWLTTGCCLLTWQENWRTFISKEAVKCSQDVPGGAPAHSHPACSEHNLHLALRGGAARRRVCTDTRVVPSDPPAPPRSAHSSCLLQRALKSRAVAITCSLSSD